jgi:hypothetical protein
VNSVEMLKGFQSVKCINELNINESTLKMSIFNFNTKLLFFYCGGTGVLFN